MLIGLMSDTHDRVPAVAELVRRIPMSFQHLHGLLRKYVAATQTQQFLLVEACGQPASLQPILFHQ